MVVHEAFDAPGHSVKERYSVSVIMKQLRCALSHRLCEMHGEHLEQNVGWDPVERLANVN